MIVTFKGCVLFEIQNCCLSRTFWVDETNSLCKNILYLCGDEWTFIFLKNFLSCVFENQLWPQELTNSLCKENNLSLCIVTIFEVSSPSLRWRISLCKNILYLCGRDGQLLLELLFLLNNFFELCFWKPNLLSSWLDERNFLCKIIM